MIKSINLFRQDRGESMNIIRMSGGFANQLFQYALYLKLRSMGKEVKFDDINEYRGEGTRPIMLSVFGLDYPRAAWEEITEFTDGSMDFLRGSGGGSLAEEPGNTMKRTSLTRRF